MRGTNVLWTQSSCYLPIGWVSQFNLVSGTCKTATSDGSSSTIYTIYCTIYIEPYIYTEPDPELKTDTDSSGKMIRIKVDSDSQHCMQISDVQKRMFNNIFLSVHYNLFSNSI